VILAVEPSQRTQLADSRSGRQLCEMVIALLPATSRLQGDGQRVEADPATLARTPNCCSISTRTIRTCVVPHWELDFVPIFQALADIDYRGLVSVEV
jgi:hypothetical protein